MQVCTEPGAEVWAVIWAWEGTRAEEVLSRRRRGSSEDGQVKAITTFLKGFLAA